ncbi:5-formyltetrahydrofolate cyclo-ligase [Fukomys damarensis]|uniref:Bcl-2-related protein A1 n=1 Tax=Fukomys damarensis TaxID=885580 RepID=A0A091DW26_FUKDA|nr:5-formyltetrahydrofolate cyclo-ligase [Fukomys damarensis]
MGSSLCLSTYISEDMVLDNFNCEVPGEPAPGCPPQPKMIDLEFRYTQTLAQEYLLHVLQVPHRGTSPSRTSRVLQDVAFSVQEKVEKSLKPSLDRFDVASIDTARTIFNQVMEKEFEDGVINWGRIVTIFAFGGVILKKLPEPIAPDGNTYKEISYFVAEFIMNHTGDWIRQNGGWVIAHRQYQKSKRISIFLSMQDEIETEEIIKDIFQQGKTCFIPQYQFQSNHMDMVKLASPDEISSLPKTSWNIHQPGGLDLIFMPGLGFDNHGNRLGRGRGYYDAYLQRCLRLQGTKPYTIALAFKEQLCHQYYSFCCQFSCEVVHEIKKDEWCLKRV